MNARAWYDKGLIYEAAGRFADAAAAVGEALALCPTDGTFRLRLARIIGARRSEGDQYREEAIEHCRRAIETLETPTETAQAWFLLGSLLDDLPDRYAEAVEAYRRGLELDDVFPVAHNNLGAVLCELGRHDEAHEHFLRAVELRPDYTTAFQNLAKMHFRWGDEARLREVVTRVNAAGGAMAPAVLQRLLVALVDFARQDAYEDF